MEGESAHIYPLELNCKNDGDSRITLEGDGFITVYLENIQHKDNHFVKESPSSLRDVHESSQLFDAS
jgi:hypothetical protein